MRLLLIILLFPFVVFSQSTTFNLTAIPLSTDFIRPDASATLWQEQGAPFGTIHIPVSGSPQPMMDAYHRFGMTEFFANASAGDSTIIFTRLDNFFNYCIDNKMGARIRVMGLCNNCGNPPNDNFNGLVNYGGGWNVIPEFLHNLQQADADASKRDWFSTRGDQHQWVANTNSWPFQRWVGKLSLAIKNHITSTSHNGVLYSSVLKIYDLGYYGCYSEQHSNCLCDQISDGTIPVGARHTDAGLMAIVNQQTNAFGGDQRWKIVIPFNAYDAIWLSHTLNTVAYGNFLLNHPDSIGWINDHLGANESYDHDYLENNFRINNAKLMNRWKFTPHGGEPVEWGQPADRSAIPQYVTNYHLSFFGNGNFNGVITNANTTQANNIRLASRLAGYRLRITGGGANVGASLVINLNWLNEGNAPPYWNWTVQYLLKNGAGTTVSTLTSAFNPRYFQPSGSPTTKTDVFGIPAIPAGQYGLYVVVRDPLNFRDPMPLAITPRQTDGSYFLGNITIPTGGTNQPPIANAGPNQTTTGTSVSLNGSSSSDPDGTISTYAWSRVSGPNTPTIVSPTSANTSVTGLIPGTYIFDLTVTDNNSATGSDQVQITVTPNQPPVANAGPNLTVTLPTSSTTLNGSGTDDNAVTGYSWTQTNGPNAAVIQSPTSASTLISGLVQGSYSFRLTVNDASGLTGFDETIVTVNTGNTAPVAIAGADQTITLPTQSVTLNGDQSFDNGGTIVAYQWTQVGGPVTGTLSAPTSANTAVNNINVAGLYIFRLQVTDDGGLTHTDDVTVTVNSAGNTAPIASAGANQVITLPDDDVTVSSAASTDNIGIISRQWTKVSGPATFTIVTPTGVATQIDNLVAGVYVFRVTVFDGSGLSDDDDVQITVNPAANIAPVANAGGNTSIQLPTNSVAASGSLSSDADGTITGYLWTFISGPATPTFTASTSVNTTVNGLTVAGTYVIRLTVTDNGGLTDTDDKVITVNAAANQPPVAIISGGAQTIQLPVNTVALDGSPSTDDVAVTSYQWSQISGPLAATIQTPTASTTNMNNLVEGVYFFQLLVSDAGGLTDTDIVQVTVLAEDPPDPPVSSGHSFWKTGVKFLPRHGHP